MDGRGMGHGRPTEQRNKKLTEPQLGISWIPEEYLEDDGDRRWIPGEYAEDDGSGTFPSTLPPPENTGGERT